MSVQKYVVTQDETGFTILKNHVLQNFCDVEALGLFVYLASLPPNWTFYKKQIADHFKLGRERLNRILKTLCDHKLITIEHKRDAQGRFVHMSLHVCSMNGFQINAQPLQAAPALDEQPTCAPLTENPSTVNQSLENDIYKDISKKKEGIKKENKNNISASSDAHENESDSFDTFWSLYPIKKNKVRARNIWNRKNLNKIAVLICNDLSNRQVNDHSWRDMQFIPHPSTYLQNERWKDEITQVQTKTKSSKNSGGDALSRVFKKHTSNQGATYDEYGNAINPLR